MMDTYGGNANYPNGTHNKAPKSNGVSGNQNPTVDFEGVGITPDDFPVSDFAKDVGTFNHACRFTCKKNVNYLEIKLSSLIAVLFKKTVRAVGDSLPIDKFNSSRSTTQMDYYRFRGVKVVTVPLADFSMIRSGEEEPISKLLILDERVDSDDINKKIINCAEWDPSSMNAAWANMPFSVHFECSKFITVALQLSGVKCRGNGGILRGLSSFTVERTNAPVKFVKSDSFTAQLADVIDTASPKDSMLIEKGLEALRSRASSGSIKAREELANRLVSQQVAKPISIQFNTRTTPQKETHQIGCQCNQCMGYTAQAQSGKVTAGLKGVNIYTAAELANAIDCTNDPPMKRIQKQRPFPPDCCQACGFDLIINFCFQCRTYKQEPLCPTQDCNTQLSSGVCVKCTEITAKAQSFTFTDEDLFLTGECLLTDDYGEPEDIITNGLFDLRDVVDTEVYQNVIGGQTVVCSCGYDTKCQVHELLDLCCPKDSVTDSIKKCSSLIAMAWYMHGEGIDENVQFHSYSGRVAELSEVQDFVAQMFPITSKGLIDVLDTKYNLGSTVAQGNECLQEWTKAAVDLQTTLHYSMATLQPIKQMNEKMNGGFDSITNFFSSLFSTLKDNSVVSLLLEDSSADWTGILKSVGIVLSVIAAAAVASRKLCLSSLKSKLLIVITAFWSPFIAKLGLGAVDVVAKLWDNCLQPIACYFAHLGGSTIEVERDSPLQVREGDITAYAQSMSMEDIFKPLSYGIMSIVSLILFKAMPAANDKHGMIGKLSALGKNMSALNGGFRSLDDWAARVVSLLQSWIISQESSDSPIVASIKLATSFDVIAWIEEVSSLHIQANRMRDFGTIERTTRIRHLYDIGMQIQEFCITHAIPYALSTKVAATHKMSLDLLNEVHAKKGYGEMRVDPFHLCLYGGPGIGKSTALGILPEDVCNYFEDPIVERRYARSTASSYWDNYCGQTYVCFDDLQSISHSTTPTDVTELIALKSNAPYQLPMAAVEEKGRFFTSKYIYSTTNLLGLLSNSKVNVSDAFLRRRNLLVLVERGKSDDGEDLPMKPGTMDHMRFSFLDPMSGNGIHYLEVKDDNGEVCNLRNMTYHAFRIEVFIMMEKYFETQEAIIAAAKIGSDVAGKSCRGARHLKSELANLTAVAQGSEDRSSLHVVQQRIHSLIGGEPHAKEIFTDLLCNTDWLLYREQKKVVIRKDEALTAFEALDDFQLKKYHEYMNELIREIENDTSGSLVKGLFPPELRSVVGTMIRSSTVEEGEVHFNEPTHKGLVDSFAPDLANTLKLGSLLYHAREKSVTVALEHTNSACSLFRDIGSQWHLLSVNAQMALKVTLAITAGAAIVGTMAYGIKTIRAKYFPQKNIISGSEMESMLKNAEARKPISTIVPTDPLDSWVKDEIKIKPQGASDISAVDLIHGPISHGLGQVMRSIDSPTTTYAAVVVCVFVGGTNILVPGHTFTDFAEDTLFFVGDGKRSYRLRFNKVNIVRLGGGNKDAILYKCGNTIPPFPSMLPHFVERKCLGVGYTSPGALVGAYHHMGKSVVSNTAIPSITQFAIKIGGQVTYMVDPKTKRLHTMQEGFSYEAHSVNGDCGSLLVGFNKRSDGKILGMHVASDAKSTTGYAEIITRDDLQFAFETIEKGGDFIVQGVSAVAQSLKLRPENESRLKRRPTGDIVACGALPPGKGISPPEKTQIIPSPLLNLIRPHTTEPAILSPNDERLTKEFSPMVDGLSKFGTPRIPFKLDDLRRIEDYLTSMFKYRDSGRLKRSVLTDEQAINGIPEEEYYDCINMSSAEGWPLSKDRPPGERNKRWLFSVAGSYQNQAPIYIMDNPRLKSLYELRESEAKQGRRVESYSIECPKDERRPLKKIYDEPATRLFAILPVDYNLLIRKYFLDFSAMVMTNRRDLPPSVGINPESMEWSELFHKLSKFSDMGFAGDYKLFDGQACPEIFHLICNVINRWYDDGPENARVRHVLLSEVSHRQTIAMDLLLQIDQGMPSGFPLTVILNCLLNMAYLRLAWLNVAPDDKQELHHFDENVMDKVYGDDNIVAIKSSALDFYNLTTVSSFLAQYGIILTDNYKKSGSEAIPSIPVSSFTFLKRGFVPYDQSPLLLLSPLDKNSIEERLMWLHSGGDDEEVLLENCKTSLRDAAHWGEEYFVDLSHRLNTGLLQTQRAPVNTTYKQVISDWYYTVTGARKTLFSSYSSLIIPSPDK